MSVADPQLLERYRRNYGLPADVELTEEMVREHWQLEQRLTRELLDSTPGTRAEAFERCYSELYRSLPWLKAGSECSVGLAPAEAQLWRAMLGPPPLDIYEIGSGDGSLARILAAEGYRFRATEITSERGDRSDVHGVTWGQTDGVHLDEFEARGSFDAVISNQVLEHLHPDDIAIHLRSARALLRPGGRIAFTTPSALTGPHDISLVFCLDAPAGMHLKEYTCGELDCALREAGFIGVASPLRLPASVTRRLPRAPEPYVSRAYLRYLIALERLMHPLGRKRQRAVARALRAALFPSNIVLVATAP